MSKVNTGQVSSTLIPKYIGSDFDKVVAVADNIEQVVIVGDNIEDVGTVADNINYVKEVAEDLHGMPVTMYTGENPPVLNPMPEGVMWYCTTDGRTYVWYTDADSGQWVESAPQSAMKDEATNIFFHATPSNVNPAYRNATLFSTSAPEAEISVAHNTLNTPVVQAQFIREEALWVDVSVTGAQGIVTLMGYSSGNSQLKAEIITWKSGAEGTSLGASQWVTLPSQPSVVSLPVTLANIDVLDAGDSYVVRLTSQMNAGGSAVSTILVDGNTSSRFGIIFNTNLIGLFDDIRDGVTTSAPTENAVYDALQLKADKTEVSDALQLKVGKNQLAQSGNLTSTANWANVPAYSDSELGGSGGPLNAQAKALTARSELLLTDVREALRRSYAEAGYTLVAGSFEAGGTVTTATDVLLDEAEGKAYSYTGTLPHTVGAGSAPSDEPGLWVDRSTAQNAFKQCGTGAVLRPAQDKMREVVSVKDFGAVGDGVADDTAAIQDALNSGATKVELSAGTYNTTAPIVIPSGISFVGEGQRLSKIRKNHAGDGVTLSNALAYNGLEIGGFSVYAVAPYKQTGTGVKITQAVRTTLKDINVSDCGYGLSMLTCYANSSNNLTIDRCGVGLSIQTSNHNNFNVVTIVSDTGFIGVEMMGTSYSNHFDTLDVEYALYPLWLKSGTTSVTFTNYYAEFNTKGARLDAGVKAIRFDTVFNSSVEMFDTATFAATSVEVNNLVDDYPVGIGGVSVRGNIGTPGISTTQNDVLFQLGVLSAAYDFSDFSKFGLNAGSYFEWTGEPRKNYINAQDLSNGVHWAGSGTVEAVGSPTIGGVPAYQFAAGAYRTHVISTDTAMAGRTFTVCVLVSGVAGGKFDLRQTDNVTETQTRTYVIGASGKRYVFHTASWGAGSTGPNIGFTIINTGSTTLDFALPCIWESPGPMPLTKRTRNHDGYTDYPIVTFQNFGETVKVFGSAAPTAGSWKVGDVVMHTAPAAVQTQPMLPAAAGTPGTWKTFGAIAP